MHHKEDTLPLLPPCAVNEPSLPPDEPGEKVRPSFETFAPDAEEDAPSKDEFEAWDDEVEPVEAVEDDEVLALWDGEIESVDKQNDNLSSWDDEIDPFEHRHLPTSVEAAPIEEADIRHAFSQANTHIMVNTPMPPDSPTRPRQGLVLRWQALPRRHRLFVLAGLLVIFLLLGDSALILLNITR